MSCFLLFQHQLHYIKSQGDILRSSLNDGYVILNCLRDLFHFVNLCFGKRMSPTNDAARTSSLIWKYEHNVYLECKKPECLMPLNERAVWTLPSTSQLEFCKKNIS